MKRLAFCLLAVLTNSSLFAGEPDLSSPTATVRSYLAATKANDVETAKRCWAVDDDNVSGTLDVVVGMWVESRKLMSATEAKFGADGLKLLGRWNRPSCTDRAIDRTLERIAVAELREGRTAARLVIPWESSDRETEPAFLCDAPFRVRRVGEQWKLDANVFTGEEKAADLFATGKLWAIWRDEMTIMKDLTGGLEKGRFRDTAEFERELKSRIDALKAKFERKD
jgi:hypothetical protein